MSPSENDLRRALHEGEGDDGVDVQTIMAAGERRRAQRRSRIGTGISVGAVVAVVVSGGVLLANTDGRNDHSAESAAGGARADARSSGAGGGKVAAPAASSAASSSAGQNRSAASPVCPTAFPRFALPGGGGTGQFGAGGKLFAEPVATITVCDYGTGETLTGRVVVPATVAPRLAASLEAASTGYPACASPNANGAQTRRYALLPTSTAGRPMRTVTVEQDPVDCPNRVTNGTAVRSSWRPPASLRRFFAVSGTSPPPGRVNGSPVRS